MTDIGSLLNQYGDSLTQDEELVMRYLYRPASGKPLTILQIALQLETNEEMISNLRDSALKKRGEHVAS